MESRKAKNHLGNVELCHLTMISDQLDSTNSVPFRWSLHIGFSTDGKIEKVDGQFYSLFPLISWLRGNNSSLLSDRLLNFTLMHIFPRVKWEQDVLSLHVSLNHLDNALCFKKFTFKRVKIISNFKQKPKETQ